MSLIEDDADDPPTDGDQGLARVLAKQKLDGQDDDPSNFARLRALWEGVGVDLETALAAARGEVGKDRPEGGEVDDEVARRVTKVGESREDTEEGLPRGKPTAEENVLPSLEDVDGHFELPRVELRARVSRPSLEKTGDEGRWSRVGQRRGKTARLGWKR
jgi:hypothetical protein